MKKFRDMTDSEKLEIINAMIAGQAVDCSGEAYDGKWMPVDSTTVIRINDCYRIPKRPMSIDWSVLKDEYICASMNKYDQSYAYKAKPEQEAEGWVSGHGYYKINGLKSYDPGTVDWQDSLIWRPGYGDNK